MNADTTKQLIKLCGESVVKRTVRAFDAAECIDNIIIVAKQDEIGIIRDEILGISDKVLDIIPGGECRALSAKIGFERAVELADFVAIHDVARCLITPEIINKVVFEALECCAASAGVPITDTVKRIDSSYRVTDTLDRRSIYLAATPQVFASELYGEAVSRFTGDFSSITDDNMLLENIGVKVKMVDCGKENIKITTQDDLKYAEYLIERRESTMPECRVGHGYDVHKLVENRELILGGVEIPFELGLLGHSDADVLTHAVMDALLGAAGLYDIGRHFPDTSAEFSGISSIALLKRVKALLDDKGYRASNIDATLVMQRPKISPYIDKMRENISEALEIDKSLVNIKATTEEGLGFTGSMQGAAAHAIAMIVKK
jgi:2-C-methyl-D-erythritol 4-phosphate cytidylyltransferase/2-C-methyl-D-erythritol 2,4-cyclodiphosphate synthase